MSLLSIFSGNDDISPTNTVDLGREAFKNFHNQSAIYPGYIDPDTGQMYTMEKALLMVSSWGLDRSDAKATIFLDGLGTAISSAETGGFIANNGVKQTMEALADKSQGKLPNPNSFFVAVKDTAANPSFITTVENVAPAVAGQIVDGAVAVGDSVVTTGKWALLALPLVVVGGLLFVAYSKARKFAS